VLDAYRDPDAKTRAPDRRADWVVESAPFGEIEREFTEGWNEFLDGLVAGCVGTRTRSRARRRRGHMGFVTD
jgi:hypothetical protein